MSPAAVLVMSPVVLVLLGAWLIAVFRATRQPASGPAHRAGREPHRPRGSRPIRAVWTRHLRGMRTRRLGRPIRPRHRKAGSPPPAQPGARERTRDTRPGLTETPTDNTLRRLNGGGHQAAFAVASSPPGLVETLPPLTVYSNTAKYPAASAVSGLAYDQRAILGASHPAPAGNAGQPASALPISRVIVNC